MLGFTSIAAEMKDADIVKLVNKIAYDEGMPVVTDPGIIKPMDFANNVITKRLPNPNIPDTPQRIAADTSQKIPIRFGETIKSYLKSDKLDVKNLTLIPLTLAAWPRYLLGLDDAGKPFTPSPDPMLESVQVLLHGIELGKPETVGDKLKKVFSNKAIFAVNLYEAGTKSGSSLGERCEGYFKELIAGPGAVRKTLHKYVII
jgi:fructuronate reductase